MLLRLLIGLSFNPEVIITEHFDFMHISAALILEIIPPLPSLEAAPAMSLIFFVIDLTSRTKSSFLLFFGGSLYFIGEFLKLNQSK